MSIHRAGLVNPNWPLCTEAIAVAQGWTADEIEDGELVDDPLIAGPPQFDAPWVVDRPPTCRNCIELVHA